jgi:hypothetical protein
MFVYSWDKNGTDSTSVLKYWLDPDSTGVISMNGWALSVEEPEQNNWVSVFPNPVIDRLTIKTSAYAGENLQIAIYDIWGDVRIRIDWNARLNPDYQFDMSELPSGLYLLTLTDGHRRMVQKIIKQ